MSDEPQIEDFEGELDAPALARSGMSGKKIVLLAGVPALLLIGAGGAYVGGAFSSGDKAEHAAVEHHSATPAVARAIFYDLPEMVVNLNVTGRRPSFLKIQVSLELADESDIGQIQKMHPRVVDNFQVYLRELRIDDLRGSAGIYRLREELLARVNATVAPVRVKDVLFKEVLVQ